MLFVRKPHRYRSVPVVPLPVGSSFHGYRVQNAVVPERQRSWGIGASPLASRRHVCPPPPAPMPGPTVAATTHLARAEDHQGEAGATTDGITKDQPPPRPHRSALPSPSPGYRRRPAPCHASKRGTVSHSREPGNRKGAPTPPLPCTPRTEIFSKNSFPGKYPPGDGTRAQNFSIRFLTGR
jgi:hypothetical protein